MDALLQEPLTALDSSLTNLITSLQTSPTFASAPAATQSLLSADDALTSALSLLEEHQQNYARILRLRSEAAQLEDNIRDIVRKAGDFRKDIDNVAPGILDEDSDDEETETEREGQHDSYADVSYTTLLSFARGIGKYNAEAVKEASEEERRLRIEARRNVTGQQGAILTGLNGAPAATNGIKNEVQSLPVESKDPEAARQILERAAGWLNQTTEERRVAGTMAFPSGERLRLGILGHLQTVREDNGGGDKGEEAVEREVNEMIAIAEGRHTVGKLEEEHDFEMGGMGPEAEHHRTHHGHGQGEVKKERKALNLDLWDESDEE